MYVPPLANDRSNKTFVKDGNIHHVAWGTRKQPSLKAQQESPAQARERQIEEGWDNEIYIILHTEM